MATKVVNNQVIEMSEEENNAFENYRASKYFNVRIENLRQERNFLLRETDWMANSDLTMSDDWKTYRQSLRDITNGITTVEDIDAVVFPTKPLE
jgi:hypothetical protein|tara:strand:+ start:522 stop:803 length:282 start_codon:yes stop_codon:yes gene_type:complete